MSDIELPSPIGSEDDECPVLVDETESSEDEVSLPSSVSDGEVSDLENLNRCGCYCKLKCSTKVPALRLHQLKLRRDRCEDDNERRQLGFLAVRAAVVDTDGHIRVGSRSASYKINEIGVCRGFWQHAHGLSSKTVDVYKRLIENGETTVPDRQKPPPKAKSQFMKADTWFLQLYHSAVEPLPNDVAPEDEAQDPYELIPVQHDSHPLWSIATGIGGNTRSVVRRYLHPQAFEAFYQTYNSEQGDRAVSKSCFRNCYQSRWKQFLGFRRIGQGKRCRTCARLDALRKSATTPEEKADYEREKQEHLNETTMDREISMRSSLLSEEAARNPNSDGLNQLLKLTLDGMDQAKFRCPRNLQSSGELKDLWRPTLHLTGAILHGWMEAYFILPADSAKDANMECTVTARVLDVWWNRFFLSTGYAAPRGFEVCTDNTTREGVNQTYATFLQFLQATRIFEMANSERYAIQK